MMSREIHSVKVMVRKVAETYSAPVEFECYTSGMRTLLMSMILVVTGPAAAPNFYPAQRPTEESAKAGTPESQPIRPFKRLILKDGSYLAISKCQIKGKLVRYLSSDRHEWEELPNSLVDWPATEKYAGVIASERQVRLNQSAKSDAQERAEEEAKSPWIAPGLRLPDTGGVFLLDRFEGGSELAQLYQNGATINKNTGSNILRGVINPIASAKRTIELQGLHARVQSHVADLAIYVALDSGDDPATAYTPETARDHFRIVRCEEKKGQRVVGVINIAFYGKANQNAAYIETRVEPLLGNWVKVTPSSPLTTGEYALVELLGKKGINTLVWDFGVNPSAPGNTTVGKAEPARDNQPPTLQKRNKRDDP